MPDRSVAIFLKFNVTALAAQVFAVGFYFDTIDHPTDAGRRVALSIFIVAAGLAIMGCTILCRSKSQPPWLGLMGAAPIFGPAVILMLPRRFPVRARGFDVLPRETGSNRYNPP